MEAYSLKCNEAFKLVKAKISETLERERILEKSYVEYWGASYKFERALDGYRSSAANGHEEDEHRQ